MAHIQTYTIQEEKSPLQLPVASQSVIFPSLSFFILMAGSFAREKSLPWLLLAAQKLNFPFKSKEGGEQLSSDVSDLQFAKSTSIQELIQSS